MRIGICDDEAEIREMLAGLVKRKYPAEKLCLYAAGEEVLLEKALPDILFLDIEMPGIDGMETAKRLRERSRSLCIIFVTVMSDMVFEAFDVGAFHYLVKPFTQEKFYEVLERAMEAAIAYRRTMMPDDGDKTEVGVGENADKAKRADIGKSGALEESVDKEGRVGKRKMSATEEADKEKRAGKRKEAAAEQEAGKTKTAGKTGQGESGEEAGETGLSCIIVKQGGVSTRVRLADILYAEVFNRKVLLHTKTSDIEYYGRLSDVEEQAGEAFFRTHRSYLVNLAYVVRYDARSITTEDGEVLLARKKYREFVRAYLKYCKGRGTGNGC